MSRVVYVVESIDSAFSSQVADVVRELASLGHSVDLFIGIASTSDLLPEIASVRVHPFRRFPAFPGLEYLSALALMRAMRNVLEKGPAVVHCRGEVSARLAFIAMQMWGVRWPVLLDVRGAVYEEIQSYFSPSRLKRMLKNWFLKSLETCYRKSVAISCVSEELKRYLMHRYDIDESKITVIACSGGSNFCFDEDSRKVVRKSIGVTEDEVLCVFATGGDAGWQDTDAIIDALVNANLKVLLLSKKGTSKEGVISMYVPYSEMHKYLSASDVGVIFRSDNVINSVACPIKFIEYLCCGLPVLSNRTVKFIDDELSASKFGVLVNGYSDIESVSFKSLCEIDRNAISSTYRERYGVVSIANQYSKLYDYIFNR